MKAITIDHAESIYRTLHYSNPNYRNSNQGLSIVYDWIHLLRQSNGDSHSPWGEESLSVFEAGCGNGKLCDFLADLRIDVTGTDIVDGPYDRSKYEFFTHDLNDPMLPYPNNSFDYCLCFDVIEHLEENEAVLLLKDLARIGRNVILKVACYGSPPLHLTIMSPGWWLDTLIEHCPNYSWQMLRSHERAIGKYAPLFYGRKKE